jgi:hypothetical protein
VNFDTQSVVNVDLKNPKDAIKISASTIIATAMIMFLIGDRPFLFNVIIIIISFWFLVFGGDFSPPL